MKNTNKIKGSAGIIVTIIAVIIVTGVMVIGFNLKPTEASKSDNITQTQRKEAQFTEENQRRLLVSTPIPKIETSQERKNLVKRLETFNTEDKISYIYLLSYGKVMAFYTVKGKVSSVNSMLTTPDQLIDANGNQCAENWNYDASKCQVVASPDIDGSYGSNGDAIFFFTTDGAYVEWNGAYMLADQPLKMSTQPELIRQVK